MRFTFDDLMDSTAIMVFQGKQVFIGIPSLPFWIKRELAKFRKEKGYTSTGWTMGEDTTEEISRRIEIYFSENYPGAEHISFEKTDEDAKEMQEVLHELGEYLTVK